MSIANFSRDDFVDRFGGVFEGSSWIAEATFDRGLPLDCDRVIPLHAALCQAMRAGTDAQRFALVSAHPDLAGRLGQTGRLTPDSANEQASAGLDQLTDAERDRFTRLNDDYKTRFGFPFIMAVKGRTKHEILAAFERRLAHEGPEELETAIAEIERIALLRIEDMFS